MFQKKRKKVTILGVVKYLAAEINVSGSAYLEYAYLKGESLFLHWYDNEPEDIEIPKGNRKFYVESDGHNKYYVHISQNNYTCKVYDYGNKNYENYIYYATYDYDIIAECGYWDKSNHYVKKVFDNRQMTEYSYKMKDGKIDESSKTKVDEGEYEYNPKLHFPRKKIENEGQGNPKDKETQLNANTEDQKNSKLNTIVK